MNATVRPPLRGTILHGEVLPPEDVLIVSAAMHPLRVEHQSVLVAAGSSIAEIVAACASDAGHSRLADGAYVEINGQPVPPRLYPHVRVKSGNHVFVKAVPKGFVVPLLMSALTSVFPILGTNALLGAIVTAGIGLLAQLVMSALFPPASNKAATAKTVYSIAGARNEVAKWEPVPSVLGRVRMAPKYAAAPVTEFSGDDQYVRMLFVWGYGPLTIDDIRIGETPIADFEDVEIETRLGYADDEAITLYTGQPVQEDLSVVPQQNEPVVRTTAEDAIEVQVDLVAPQGIYRQDKKSGNLKSYSVSLRIEIKAADASDSTYQVMENVTLEGDSQDPIRRTYRRKVASGQYTIRVTRLSQNPDQEPNKGVAVNWTALRIFRKAPPVSFPKPLAMTAIRIRASDQLNGTPDDVNGIVTTRCKVWTNSAWVNDTKASPRPSTWPHDLFRHVLQGPANKRPVADSKIDLATIQSWAARNKSKGFYFNMNRDFRSSVWETLRDVCAAGRAVPLFRDGKWSVAWEDPAAPVVQHFTPRNSWNMRRRQEYRELPHALRVKFQDAAKGWIEDERLVYADGYSKANATLVEQAEFPGITSKDLVYKHGRYRLAEGKLRPASFMLSVDAEHLVCTRGDRVYVAHDVLMNSLASGRVVAVSGQAITLDEPVTMEVAGEYVIRFRRPDGTSLLRSIALDPGSQSTITLRGVTGAVPAPGDLWSFGPADQEARIYRVKSIRPMEDLSAELELVDDAPEIEASDSGAIPDYDSGLVMPPDLRQFPPYTLQVIETVEPRGTAAVFATTIIFKEVAGVNADSFIVDAQSETGRTVRGTSLKRRVRFENLTPGVWTFYAQSVYKTRRSIWSDPFQATLLGKDRNPEDPKGFEINPIADVATLTWDEPSTPVQRSEIRYTPATSGATWASAVPLITNAKGTSAQTAFQSGTYLIKHISYGGVASQNPAMIVVTNAGEATRNVVQEYFELSPFDGTHVGTFDGPMGLELASAFDIFTVDDVFAVEDVFLGEIGYVESGVYTAPDTIDLGETFTSRVSVDLLAQGINAADNIFAYPNVFALANVFGVDPDQWDVEAQVQTTRLNPSVSSGWSEWRRLVVGDYTARAFRFRLLLAATDFGITPRVTLLHVMIDMPDRVEGGRDLVVPVTGLRINFNPPFRALTGLSRSDQELQTGDRAVITNQGPTGFDIIYRNSAGAAVQRTFDYVAKGYGRRTS